MLQSWRHWLQHKRLQTPLAILSETYRPLAFFAEELLSAAEPFLPDTLTQPQQTPPESTDLLPGEEKTWPG